MAANSALNPASVAWGRDVEKRNDANAQALIRATMDLQNTDRAQQDSITRLNAALESVRLQNEYILSLAVHNVQSKAGDTAITTGTWTTVTGLRPAVTLRAPSGRIRVTISGYGHNAVLTYSIPGVVDREVAISSYINQAAQLVLPGGNASMTSQKEWVQLVPADQYVTVQVECRGAGDSPVVAAPSIIVQVLPAE